MREGKELVANEGCPRGLWIEQRIRVCTYDIDFASHVSNISYLRWLEDMRYQLFEKYFPLKMFMDEGKSPIITETNIQYKRPIRLFAEPHGVMWISDLRKASLTISAEIYVENILTTTARHTGVFIDVASGKPVRIPQICMQTMQEHENDMVPVKR